MFDQSPLRRLLPDAAIYNLPDMKIPEVRYTRAGRQALPEVNRPRLHGITIDGRVAVMFSNVDITTGLLGIGAIDCVGYSPKSAFEIARNVLLYATDKSRCRIAKELTRLAQAPLHCRRSAARIAAVGI